MANWCRKKIIKKNKKKKRRKMTSLKLMNIDEMGHDGWKLIQIDWIVIYIATIIKIIHISAKKRIYVAYHQPPNNVKLCLNECP